MNTNTSDTNGLLDTIIARNSLKNDAALARFFEVAPPVISKMRHGRLPVGATMILSMLDREIMTLAEIRSFVPRAA